MGNNKNQKNSRERSGSLDDMKSPSVATTPKPIGTDDIELPKISFPRKFSDPHRALRSASISFEEIGGILAAALTTATDTDIREYLHRLDRIEVTKSLEEDFIREEHPVLFFAIARNDSEIVAELLEYSDYGVGANVKNSQNSMPALAFAVLYGSHAAQNTLEVFKILLANGADPEGIPRSLWGRYINRPTLQVSGQDTIALPSLWCRSDHRKLLVRGLTLSHRYCLWNASIQTISKGHKRQALKLHNMSRLFNIRYYLIGQAPAAKLVESKLFSHVTRKKDEPLVMFFAGPSGHGKPELAERLGSLLNVSSMVIDCAQIREAQELIGWTSSYRDAEDDSPFNNFLTLQNGQRSVVFLDEVEKMGKNARLALLRLLDLGTYTNRAEGGGELSTKQRIFILGTNQGSDTIQRWYSEHLRGKNDEEIANANLNALIDELRSNFTGAFGAPLTGRCSQIVPSLPFSDGEAAVVAHSFLMKDFDCQRKPVNIERKDLMGHIHLNIEEDEVVATTISKPNYSPDLGARSIRQAAERLVGDKIADVRGEHDGETTEDVNDGPLRKDTVQAVPRPGGGKDIAVFEANAVEASAGGN